MTTEKKIPLSQDVEKIQRIFDLRENENWSWQKIGNEFGVSRERIRQIYTKHGGTMVGHLQKAEPNTCTSCGKIASKDFRYAELSRKYVCSECRRHYGDGYKWSHEKIIEAMHRFYERYGRQPRATDFNPALAKNVGRDDRADRFHADGDYPYVNTVRQYFGSWNNAIIAAGWEPRDQNALAFSDPAATERTWELRHKYGLTIKEIAEIEQITDTGVRKRLEAYKRHGGKPRRWPRQFRRQAAKQVLINNRSLEEVAQALGIPKETLRDWVYAFRYELVGDKETE